MFMILYFFVIITGLSEHADRFKKILSGLVCKNLEKSLINLTYFDLLGFL